jgi:hypothetical protein
MPVPVIMLVRFRVSVPAATAGDGDRGLSPVPGRGRAALDPTAMGGGRRRSARPGAGARAGPVTVH